VLKTITKMMTMTFTVLFLLGAIGVLVGQPSKAYAAESTQIGVVDYKLLIDSHPDMQKANDSFKAELEQAKQTFATKSANMKDEDKKALEATLSQEVEKKRQELFQDIESKVNAAVKAVADAKGLSIILPKNNVVYGGQDITDAVLAKIKG
jgi:outer membrane protein